MNRIKAIIFDMDGVLINAKDWHCDSFLKALAFYGYTMTREEHNILYDGLPSRKKLELLSKEKELPKELYEQILQLKQKYTVEYINMYCKPLAIHKEALSKLEEEGYKLALASNSIRQTVDLMLEKAELNNFLKFSLSNQDVINPKPDPEIYNLAISKLKMNPKECLILEDNDNGIKSALASGAHLLKIETIYDVTYHKIKNRIKEIEFDERN